MYITWYRRRQPAQYDFEQMYRAYITDTALAVDSTPYPRTQTAQADTIPWAYDHYLRLRMEMSRLALLQSRIIRTDIASHYTTFMIPKRSGGFRQINAPDSALLDTQHKLVDMLQNTARMLSHDAAFAYVPKRCAKHALMRHQKSRWFLKLDIQDFFPSWTKTDVKAMLSQLYPLATKWDDLLTTGFDHLLDMCFLNDALPQGAATSPMLSNLCMVPFDDALTRALRDFDGRNFKYTRYADDLLISCEYDFDHKKVLDKVKELLPPNLHIKESKTRYGSSAGRNWNLGLMLNKDQQITVGHKRKETAKAMMYNVMKDNGASLSDKETAQTILGQLAYIDSIEPDFLPTVNAKYQERFQCASCKEILVRRIKELN